MTRKPYTYEVANVARIVDGDTFDAVVQLTPTITAFRRIRIRGIDAPELRVKDPAQRQRGQYSQALLTQLIGSKECRLILHGRDHYGRWVCDVSNEDYTDIGGAMITMGGAIYRRTAHERDDCSLHLHDEPEIATRHEYAAIAGNQFPVIDLPY